MNTASLFGAFALVEFRSAVLQKRQLLANGVDPVQIDVTVNDLLLLVGVGNELGPRTGDAGVSVGDVHAVLSRGPSGLRKTMS